MFGGSISAFLRGLRWQDGADVLLLTVLFSWAYTWMRRTIAVQMTLGMVTLLAASWIASHFGLILTSYLLSAVSAVAVASASSGLRLTRLQAARNFAAYSRPNCSLPAVRGGLRR